MSVIFDTSIWIEYFRVNSNYFASCQQLIDDGKVYALEVIFAELLQGALNKKETEVIKLYYNLLNKIEIETLFLSAGVYSSQEKLFNKGVGLIDASILLATIRSGSKLWTLDKKLKSCLPVKFHYELN